MSVHPERDAYYLDRIMDYCEEISDRQRRFSIDRDRFIADEAYQDMLLLPLLQIGEAANHLSKELITSHSDIPWSEIIGLRHVIVHGYEEVQPEWIWVTLDNDVPPLLEACESIRASLHIE